MILRPSLHPSSRSRWRNAAVHSLCAGAPPEPSNPMTGSGGCCARGAEAHVTAAPLNSVMNSRRLMPDLGFFSRIVPSQVSGTDFTQCSNSESFDRLISRDLHSQRHGKTERLCGLEIDDKLEHGRLRDR